MIDDGIERGVYKKSSGTTLNDLAKFKSFLYCNFSKYEKYEDMYPESNQPASIYGENTQIQDTRRNHTWNPQIPTANCTKRNIHLQRSTSHWWKYLRPFSRKQQLHHKEYTWFPTAPEITINHNQSLAQNYFSLQEQ